MELIRFFLSLAIAFRRASASKLKLSSIGRILSVTNVIKHPFSIDEWVYVLLINREWKQKRK